MKVLLVITPAVCQGDNRNTLNPFYWFYHQRCYFIGDTLEACPRDPSCNFAFFRNLRVRTKIFTPSGRKRIVIRIRHSLPVEGHQSEGVAAVTSIQLIFWIVLGIHPLMQQLSSWRDFANFSIPLSQISPLQYHKSYFFTCELWW